MKSILHIFFLLKQSAKYNNLQAHKIPIRRLPPSKGLYIYPEKTSLILSAATTCHGTIFSDKLIPRTTPNEARPRYCESNCLNVSRAYVLGKVSGGGEEIGCGLSICKR